MQIKSFIIQFINTYMKLTLCLESVVTEHSEKCNSH